MTKFVMADIETWGTEPGCDLRSIGAVVFDPETGEIGDGDDRFYVATENPRGFWGKFNRFYAKPDCAQRKYKLSRDPKTVKWWSEQSDEAQAAFADPVDLKDALERFDQWLCHVGGYESHKQSDAIRLWSHGPAFDPPILAAAYKSVGLPVPWHYRTLRDTRTLFDVAGITEHGRFLAKYPGPLGVVHHALDDAVSQAIAVCEAFKLIREPVEVGRELYRAGTWSLPTGGMGEATQGQLWERMRDALGLRPGTATSEGVGS